MVAQNLDLVTKFFPPVFVVSNDDVGSTSQNVSYDVSKLVDFPGFNVPAHQTKDVSTFQTKCYILSANFFKSVGTVVLNLKKKTTLF